VTLFNVISNHADLSFRGTLSSVIHIFSVLSFILSPHSLPRNPSSNIPDPIPLDPPHCHSLSPSLLFSLSPSLESHMVSLKWSAIKRGAQGARYPHLFSCSAWAVCSLVETVSCDILWGRFARYIYAARAKNFSTRIRVHSVLHCWLFGMKWGAFS